jgi:hypothetical protein
MLTRIVCILVLCFFAQCRDNRNLLSEKEKGEITEIHLYYCASNDDNVYSTIIIKEPKQVRYFLDNFLGNGRRINVLKLKKSGTIILYNIKSVQSTFNIRARGLYVEEPYNGWFMPKMRLHDFLKELQKK